MNRWSIFLALVVFTITVAIGCAGGNGPVTPDTGSNLTAQSSATSQSHNVLWGYYDLYFDFENGKVEAVANRNVAFTANVVTFINPKPAGLVFKINGTPVFPEYIGVDIDVTIAHPLALAAYDGYDVKGIFVGDGSGTMGYDSQLKYAKRGVDQFLTNADGYTRWFNPAEFTIPGVLGYTPGTYATKSYSGSATLNPYKYFAKGLSATGDLWNYLDTTSSEAGYFKNSTSNTRNYLLEFPVPTPGVKYGYAIAASWEGEAIHPAYAPEAPAINVTITDDVYYVDNTNKGGDLILDVDIWGWDQMPSTVVIESTVLTTNATFDLSTETPTGGNENYSSYHFEIPANNITGTDGQEFWVICQYDEFDYSNTFGVPNGAGTDPLAAFFRYDIFVADEPYNQDPICVLNYQTTPPASSFLPTIAIGFDASGSTDPESDPLSFAWDFDGDGNYGESVDDSYTGTPDKPTHSFTVPVSNTVYVKVTDGQGGESICTKAVSVTQLPSKNIQLRSGVTAVDLAVSSGTGNLFILYSDGQVWRYLESSSYQSGTMFYNIGATTAWRIDARADDYTVVTGNITTPGVTRSYTDTGTLYTNYNAWVGTTNFWRSDVWFIERGTNAGRFGSWVGTDYSGPPPYESNGTIYQISGSGGGNWGYPLTTGVNYIHPNYVVGTECDYNGTYVYTLEKAPEYRVERRNIYITSYASISWGGVQSDTSPNFYNPKDITRNASDTYFVLDELSTGNPAIKKFSATGTPQGTFGSTTTISSTPLRIEGSERLYGGSGPNLMFVLHGNVSAGYYLSIFFPSELS